MSRDGGGNRPRDFVVGEGEGLQERGVKGGKGAREKIV